MGNCIFLFPEAEHVSFKLWIAAFHNSSQMSSPQKSKSNPFGLPFLAYLDKQIRNIPGTKLHVS